VGILAVQVVIVCDQRFGRNLPSLLDGLAAAACGAPPTGLFYIELGDGQGFGARVGFIVSG